MTPQELRQLRRDLGMSARRFAAALSDPDRPPRINAPNQIAGQVDPRTVRRWESGAQDIPGPVVAAVKLMVKDN